MEYKPIPNNYTGINYFLWATDLKFVVTLSLSKFLIWNSCSKNDGAVSLYTLYISLALLRNTVWSKDKKSKSPGEFCKPLFSCDLFSLQARLVMVWFNLHCNLQNYSIAATIKLSFNISPIKKQSILLNTVLLSFITIYIKQSS